MKMIIRFISRNYYIISGQLHLAIQKDSGTGRVIGNGFIRVACRGEFFEIFVFHAKHHNPMRIVSFILQQFLHICLIRGDISAYDFLIRPHIFVAQ